MIFGVGAPKFKVGTTIVNLDYVTINKNEPDYQIVEHESIINRHREYLSQGAHWTFEVSLNLHKYTDPISKYNELKAYEGTLIDELYRHRDGEPFYKKGTTTPCKFYVASIKEFYLEDVYKKDVLIITLKSVDTIKLTNSTRQIPQLTEILMSNSF